MFELTNLFYKVNDQLPKNWPENDPVGWNSKNIHITKAKNIDIIKSCEYPSLF